MSLTIKELSVPIQRTEDGAVRVGRTRVTLHTVIRAFQRDTAPETIVRQFDALQLADVYAVIAYYLRYPEEVEAYLQEEEREGEKGRQFWEARSPSTGLKERLLARRAAQEASDAELPRG